MMHNETFKMMMAPAADKVPCGESEIFEIVRRLIEETKSTFPNADREELERTIDAAVKEVLDETETR